MLPPGPQYKCVSTRLATMMPLIEDTEDEQNLLCSIAQIKVTLAIERYACLSQASSASHFYFNPDLHTCGGLSRYKYRHLLCNTVAAPTSATMSNALQSLNLHVLCSVLLRNF